MDKKSKIFVAGHKGMVGSAIYRELKNDGYENIITKEKTSLDLKNNTDVKLFFEKEKPDYVFLAAAKVGGINANIKNPAVFLFDNLVIQNNVINQAYLNGVKKLCFIGSSCIYPKQSPQPIKEEYLLTGPLEPTNEGYALAKITGLKLTEYYNKQYGFNSVNPMPCNLYGPNDSFDLEHSHVLSALVKKFVDATADNTPHVTLWGTGIARREFMHVSDAAAACIFLMENHDDCEHINVGWGKDISIKELAEMIIEKIDYKGEIIWDKSKPDGMLKKCLDITKLTDLGFKPKISLSQGLDEMISIYKSQKNK